MCTVIGDTRGVLCREKQEAGNAMSLSPQHPEASLASGCCSAPLCCRLSIFLTVAHGRLMLTCDLRLLQCDQPRVSCIEAQRGVMRGLTHLSVLLCLTACWCVCVVLSAERFFLLGLAALLLNSSAAIVVGTNGPTFHVGDGMPWSGLAAAGVNALGSILGSSGGASIGDVWEGNVHAARNMPRHQVAGAQAAGLHPLYVMGNTPMVQAGYQTGGKLGDALQAASQGIGRAVDAARSQSERQEDRAYELELRNRQLQRADLENELLRSQLSVNQVATNPPLPSTNDRYLVDGQAQSGLVQTKPMERNAVAPERKSQEPAAVADVGFSRTEGGYSPTYSADVKERLEDDPIGMIAWNIRNRILPTFQLARNPPPIEPPAGYKWRYHPIFQEYVPMRRNRFGIWRSHPDYERR